MGKLGGLRRGLLDLAMNLETSRLRGPGLMDLEGMDGRASGIAYERLASLVVELPAALLLCAVLCLVCGARTFREEQHSSSR